MDATTVAVDLAKDVFEVASANRARHERVAIATAITLTVNVPIDGQIAGWTVGTLPADWDRIRKRWEFYHGCGRRLPWWERGASSGARCGHIRDNGTGWGQAFERPN